MLDPALIQLQYIGSANNLHHLNDEFIILFQLNRIPGILHVILKETPTLFICCRLLGRASPFPPPPHLSCLSLSLYNLCVACKAAYPW
jgi:hypothetical protein